MKKINIILQFQVIALVIMMIFVSCGNNDYEKKLIGNWYSMDELGKFEITKDSIHTQPLYKRVNWKATQDSIQFRIRNEFKDSIYTISLKYYFSNDTLLIYPYLQPEVPATKFVKANDFLDFLFTKNQVNIKLPSNNAKEILSESSRYGFKIFGEYMDNKVKWKTEYSNDLSSLAQDFKKHLEKFEDELKSFEKDFADIDRFKGQNMMDVWTEFNVHIPLFADANIPKESIDSLYQMLKESIKVKKVYQIYGVNESIYVDFYLLEGVRLGQ